MARVLLAHHADVNLGDFHGWTPLFLACSGGSGSVELILLLLKHGADASIKSVIGWSPLSAAAYHGRLDLVKVLLDHGGQVGGMLHSSREAVMSFEGQV